MYKYLAIFALFAVAVGYVSMTYLHGILNVANIAEFAFAGTALVAIKFGHKI